MLTDLAGDGCGHISVCQNENTSRLKPTHSSSTFGVFHRLRYRILFLQDIVWKTRKTKRQRAVKISTRRDRVLYSITLQVADI